MDMSKENSDVVHMTGRLLIFDKISKNGVLFPKTCSINIPEKVPVIMDFNMWDPNRVLGLATVTKDDIGYMCDVEIINPHFTDILKCDDLNELPIGGYYTNVSSKIVDGFRVVDKAHLRAISVVCYPADDESKIRIVKDKE